MCRDRYGAPVLGWVMSGSGAEYGHLKNSILRFPSVSEWTALMEDAGKIHLVAPLPPGAYRLQSLFFF